jgi:hypothetical protein
MMAAVDDVISNNYYQIMRSEWCKLRVTCEDCKQSFESELDYELHRDLTGHKSFVKSI